MTFCFELSILGSLDSDSCCIAQCSNCWFSLFNVDSVAYRESVQDSRCWRGLWTEPGLLCPRRWLTVQWKRLKYELLYCFAPRSVKWQWGRFCRRGVFQVQLQIRGHSTMKKSSTVTSIHNLLFSKTGALERSCLALHLSDCAPPHKVQNEWPPAALSFYGPREGTCSEISCRCDRMAGWWQLIKGDSGAPSEPLRDRGIKLAWG